MSDCNTVWTEQAGENTTWTDLLCDVSPDENLTIVSINGDFVGINGFVLGIDDGS